jgi:hypothetical protein
LQLPPRDEQVGVGVHRPPGELAHQRRLALAGPTGHKDDPALPGQRCVKIPIQSRQLAPAGDEDGPLEGGRRLFLSEKSGGGWMSEGACPEPVEGYGSRNSRLRRARAFGPDALVQSRDLVGWREVQLLLQNPHTLPILTQGGAVAASLGI